MRISLSEQAEVDYRVAGFGSRSLAYTFDFFIRWTVVVAFLLTAIFLFDLFNQVGFSFGKLADLFLSAQRDTGSGRLLIAAVVILIFVVEWGYPICFEVFNAGVTPGKQMFGLRVVDETGLPIDLRSSALRTIMLLFDLLPGIAAVGFLSMAMTKRYQRLGDLVARTMVIYDEEREQHRPGSIRRGGPANYRLPLPLFNLIEEFIQRAPAMFPENKYKLQLDITKLITAALPSIAAKPGESVLSIGELKELLADSEPIREQYRSPAESQRRPGAAGAEQLDA